MIAEMITSAHLAFSRISTDAIGETAQYIAKQLNEGRRSMQSAHSFGLGVMGAVDALCEMVKQCDVENWDGYGAAPVTTKTFQQAINVLEALPLWEQTPRPWVLNRMDILRWSGIRLPAGHFRSVSVQKASYTMLHC